MSNPRPLMLLILDGWGHREAAPDNAISAARTPNWDPLWKQRPRTLLETSGEAVGLPAGQMGNSEVGHMNLGAGRIVYQDLAKINMAVENGEMAQEEVLIDAMQYAKANNKKLHFIGLLSDGGVHAHIKHLEGLLQVAKEQEVENVFVHAFTDGRDVDPKRSEEHT